MPLLLLLLLLLLQLPLMPLMPLLLLQLLLIPALPLLLLQLPLMPVLPLLRLFQLQHLPLLALLLLLLLLLLLGRWIPSNGHSAEQTSYRLDGITAHRRALRRGRRGRGLQSLGYIAERREGRSNGCEPLYRRLIVLPRHTDRLRRVLTVPWAIEIRLLRLRIATGSRLWLVSRRVYVDWACGHEVTADVSRFRIWYKLIARGRFRIVLGHGLIPTLGIPPYRRGLRCRRLP